MLHIKPKNAERMRNYNIVVGYFQGKAIIRNENGFFFFIECEECHAPEGTVIENEALTSIDNLSEDEKLMILDIFEERD